MDAITQLLWVLGVAAFSFFVVFGIILVGMPFAYRKKKQKKN
jgi:hypothetical protein